MPLKDPVKRKEYRRQWRLQTRDARHATEKVWREANRDACRAKKKVWQAANRDARRRGAQRRRACITNVPGEYTKDEWQDVLVRYGMTCAICGHPFTARSATVDHFVPLSAGGPAFISNIQPLCKSCNSRKGSRIPTFEEQLAFIAHRKTLGLPAALVAEVL